MTYQPEPLDTSSVQLSPELLELTEQLSEHAHAIWAQQRLLDGWTYGPNRDDARKQHPGLVPYDELTDGEKQYDRNAALATLKAVLALGYRIHPPGDDAAVTPEEFMADLGSPVAVLEALSSDAAPDLDSLMALWRGRNDEEWARLPDAYRRLAERLLGLGEPLLAYDVIRDGLRHSPADVRLRQLQGLALARSGATERAHQTLRALYDEGHTDEETLGMLARASKDFWANSTDPKQRQVHLREAADLYTEAFRRFGGHWTGINAATMTALLGDQSGAAELAGRVREQCLRALDEPSAQGEGRYWLLATLGETALILGDLAEAEDWYAQAAAAGGRRLGDLASTRRNARLLLRHLGRDAGVIERALRVPPVVVFSGHMIDHPGRERPRFPARLEGAVQAAIRTHLKELGAGVGYASAACGSDLLFLEAMLDLGGEAHVVLPYRKEQFVEDSVDVLPDTDWVARFERVLERASEVIVASEQRFSGGGTTYEYANLLLHGLATKRAEQLDAQLVPLAVWDGKAGDGGGGTASAVRFWQEQGLDVRVVDLATLLGREFPELAADDATASPDARRTPPTAATELPREVATLLFADAVGFSRLEEDEVSRFIEHFLGAVGRLANEFPHPPVMKNTWGDGLYFVFSDVAHAGQFALDLSDLVNTTPWAERGLPADLNIRTGLHVGPVFRCVDPVSGQINYIGAHVSRAARIEPITPAGQVYASQAFAALAAAMRSEGFKCDYVGQTPQAKGYGVFPTYHVRRA